MADKECESQENIFEIASNTCGNTCAPKGVASP